MNNVAENIALQIQTRHLHELTPLAAAPWCFPSSLTQLNGRYYRSHFHHLHWTFQSFIQLACYSGNFEVSAPWSRARGIPIQGDLTSDPVSWHTAISCSCKPYSLNGNTLFWSRLSATVFFSPPIELCEAKITPHLLVTKAAGFSLNTDLVSCFIQFTFLTSPSTRNLRTSPYSAWRLRIWAEYVQPKVVSLLKGTAAILRTLL